MDHVDIWIVLDRPFFLRYDKNIQNRYTTSIGMAIVKTSRLFNALVIISTLSKEDYHAGIHKNTPFSIPDNSDSIVPLYLAFSSTNPFNGY
jgi:hypothetical protein